VLPSAATVTLVGWFSTSGITGRNTAVLEVTLPIELVTGDGVIAKIIERDVADLELAALRPGDVAAVRHRHAVEVPLVRRRGRGVGRDLEGDVPAQYRALAHRLRHDAGAWPTDRLAEALVLPSALVTMTVNVPAELPTVTLAS